MRRWRWAALGVLGMSAACDKPEAPALEDPAATATAVTPPGAPAEGGPAPAASSGAADSPRAPAMDAGGPPPDAPLARWMNENPARALRARDPLAVAAAFDAIAGFAPKAAPPAYANWVSIAKDGAASARAANLDGATAACRGCHTQYRADYKAQLRSRPLP